MVRGMKNMDFRRLHALKTKMDLGHPGGVGFPIDWSEFNKLYSTSAPVVVRCPRRCWDKVEGFLAFYAGLRAVRDDRVVGVVTDNFFANHSILRNAVDAISPAKGYGIMRDNIFDVKDPLQMSVNDADDWVFALNWGATEPLSPLCYNSLKVLNASNGFKAWDDEIYRAQVFFGEPMRPRKKVVVFWSSEDDKFFPQTKEKYKDRFLFIDYTREKQLVDEWFDGNETMLDPMFDIMIMDTGLDLRKVFMYAASNYLRGFKEYAKVFPDTVGRYIGERAFKAFMG